MSAITATTSHRRLPAALILLVVAAVVAVAFVVAAIANGDSASDVPAPASVVPASPYDPFADEFNTELRGVEPAAPYFQHRAEERAGLR